ncbi:hypothetical protein LEP1GSC058_0246 [Leptospira fainei serovar Hurstbridge str. BUT 6]|uniref:Polyketide cyclase/dehydrase and lipid transport n=1 Tax=Leptospira fainei serovar Hurstbridge str. BUT 6 TaxID=1193011 RepID=S3UPW7_9LEPT|nr:hypothetical protein [Leptospira fainei]EPG72446.1 hypothetical protein LEP1GSC058_0246 [Leptospira fainei serovar Hurstbridge str. BUT 6]
MNDIFEVLHLSISVDLPKQIVYDFLSEPRNFPEWASGLCKSISPGEGDEWLIEAPEGNLRARFTDRNIHGVLDHYVILESGNEIYIPMRLISNGSGCELILTLFRLADMTSEKFKEDRDWVLKDLHTMRSLLEKKFSKRN